MAIEPVEPTSQQAEAIARIGDWLDAYRTGRSVDQVFRLFGYAGTGKTTLIKYITDWIGGSVVYAAFTGKAARVMRRHIGREASTIHSLCYRPVAPRDEIVAEMIAEIEALPTGAPERMVLERRLVAALELGFIINEDSLAGLADLIVIDECSMVDEEMGQDLLSFGRPVLVLGDPAQLPPIDGHGFFTREDEPPDVMLTEIHRQAAGNPIIQVATMAREGRRIPFGRHGATVRKTARRDVANGRAELPDHLDRLMGVEQVVVAKNLTRRWLNKLIRDHKGLRHPEAEWLPTDHDKIIIRHNYRRHGLLNGDFVTLKDASWNPRARVFSATVVKEDGAELPDKPIYAGRFMDHYDYRENREALDHFHARGSIIADFGYVLTAHTAQGSQWRSVLVVDERMKGSVEDHRRWLYTAVTRAEKLLLILG